MRMLFPRSVFNIPQFFLVFTILTAMLCCATGGDAQTTPTNVQITGAVLQKSVNRLGINLGDQDYWDSGQMMKNLIFENPGFEGLKYRVIFHCATVTANTCMDDNQFNAQPAGYWNGGTYLVISGNSAGVAGNVVSNTAASSCVGCGPTITFDKNVNLAVGDYFSVVTYIPGSGDTGWADDIGGGGTITTETTDLSPETPGKQAMLLSASGSGQSASLTSGFDTWNGLSFIQLNGNFEVTFRAKGMGGSNILNVVSRRLQPGLGIYLDQNVTLTNTWQNYTLNFSAAENGTAVGPVQLIFLASGSSVELDDVSLDQTNSSTSNPTAFRDGVVSALQQLNPGTIRMMAAGAALGSDLPNQIQAPFARYREGFNADGTSYADISYGIHEFLQLCQTVGSDPWITIPTATTPTEMTEFIEYLTGTGSDPWSALRISRGQTAPWTTVFGKIHLELGNETWNGYFKGESMNYPQYPEWANTVFGAARQTPGYEAGKFDLVLSGLAATPGYNQPMLTYSTQHDSFDIAPYILANVNNEPQSTMFGAMYAEPELYETPTGEVSENILVGEVSPSATSATTGVSVYETNLGGMGGNVTEAQLNLLTPSIGAGIAHADHMLQMMRGGVTYQNAFALPQYEFQRGDGSLVKLWGMVVDMGTTNRRRPQFLTQAMANSVIGGAMMQTVQTGANPTWNQPLSSDNVQLNGAHFLQSFAFLNGTTASAVLFNVNQTTALPVVFSGENAPAGTVQMTQITSANITDNNETASVVAPTTQTLSSFNASAGLTLPPFSMTVLTWTSTFVQSPNFSVAAGTYSTTQSVALSSVTAGATIYYTTNGSTPTTASTKYTGPITISQTTTLNAIAVAANLTNSQVATALYTIQPVAASPVFSLASGTYNAGQTVTITDVVPGSTIYYTTDGSTPTASSTVYTGTLAVNVNETLSAIAGAPNYTLSGVSTAAYIIAPPTPAPVISVASGTYQYTQYVQLSDSMSAAAIFYTTDGSTPTLNSARSSSGVVVSSTETVKAIAIAPGYSSSSMVSASYVIAPYVATPVLSLPGGTYNTPQTVIITDATPGATIHFTRDQTTPTASSPVYSGPITISSCDYVQAIAVATGYTQSFNATANYIMTVGTPTFSIAGGTYAGTQTVTISDVSPGASLFYTTNGSTPTTASNPVIGPITVSSSETIKAVGMLLNYTSSAIGVASYTITAGTTATPAFSVAAGTYTTAQTVTLSDSTSGANIYYTTNGTAPTTSSTLYSGAITVGATETVEAIAVASGYSNSTVASAAYVINLPAATPSFSIAAGTYTSVQTVTLSDATSGAQIYYTTNGTAPTTASTLYSGAITVGATETVEAIAVASGYSSSAVASAAYTIALPAAAPSFSIASGTYTSVQTVALSDSTIGAKIYYTTNGTTPTTSSTLYSGAITVGATETVEAIAAATGNSNSAVASAAYTIALPAATPVFSVAAGTYSSAQMVAIGDSTAGASIYYTTNGTAPTTASTLYLGPIAVRDSETLSAIAVATDYSPSAVVSADYTIKLPAETPEFSVEAGTYASAQSVALSDATAGASIYYTTNGTAPTPASTLYSGPIPVGTSETVEAIAVATGYSPSAVASAAYTINPPTETQSSAIGFDGPVTPGTTLNVIGAAGDVMTIYSVPTTFKDSCSSIPTPVPATVDELQVTPPNVPLTTPKQSLTLSAALTEGQRLCLKAKNGEYIFFSPSTPVAVKTASPAVSIVGNPAQGTTGVTVLATAAADIWVYSFPSSHKLLNGATLCGSADVASNDATELPIGPRGAHAFSVVAGAQSTLQLTNAIAAGTQLCLEANPGPNAFYSALVPIKATAQPIAFNGIPSPGSTFSVTGQTGATVSLYSIKPSDKDKCNKNVAKVGTLLKFSSNADNFVLPTAASDLTLSSPVSDGELLCLTAVDAGAAPGSVPTEFATTTVVGFIRFAETPVAGKNTIVVEGDPGYPLYAYQFPAGFKPKTGPSCGPDDISGANGQVTLLHFSVDPPLSPALEPDKHKPTKPSKTTRTPGPVTIPVPAPTAPGVTSLVEVDSTLVAGTVLCLVESANETVYSIPQTVVAKEPVQAEPGFAHSFYTVGAVISNELGTSNSTGAAQYVDLGFAFRWWQEGESGKVRRPGFDTSFSGRFSSIPVAAGAASNPAPAPTTALNVLTSQESARVMSTASLPFRIGPTSSDGDSLFIAAVAKASFTTLINPSATLTPQAGSTSVPVQYSPTYNDWSLGGRIGWRRYYGRKSNAATQTLWQLDGTIGKFSNLQDLQCNPKVPISPAPTSAPTNTSCFITTPGNSSATPPTPTTYTEYQTLRVSVPRLELDGFARIPSTIFVIGIDANLSQYAKGVPKNLDTMNRAGSDVRIYFGISGSISDLFKKLSLPTP